MTWTEPKKNNIGVYEVFCKTPLGEMSIEWFGRADKFTLGFVSQIRSISQFESLDAAKDYAHEYLVSKHRELSEFLNL